MGLFDGSIGEDCPFSESAGALTRLGRAGAFVRPVTG